MSCRSARYLSYQMIATAICLFYLGLQSPTAGYVAFNMKTVSFNSNCTFPPWLSYKPALKIYDKSKNDVT